MHLFIYNIIVRRCIDIKRRTISILLCMVLLLCFTSCQSKEKREFKAEAEKFFKTFQDVREGGKAQKEFEYTKSGSYAIEKPVTDSAADGEIDKYLNGLVENFKASAQEGDKLFVSYRLHSANESVGAVELVSNKGDSTVIHFDKKSDAPMSRDLKTAVTAHAKIMGHEFTGEPIFTKDGIKAGDVTVEYRKLIPTLPLGLRETMPDTVRVVDLSKKLVAITYDDGPCKYTDDILDILEEHGSVATFFELGQLMSSQPEALKRMDKLGCEIGSHTWSHKDLTKISAAEIRSQLSRTDAALEKITGKKTTLMRPPYGAVSKSARSACDKPMIGWSLDTLDWQSRNADKIIDKIKNGGELDGQVILMHSLYESSVDATREIVPWLIENGYQLVTVSELFEYKYLDKAENGRYYTSAYFKEDNNK